MAYNRGLEMIKLFNLAQIYINCDKYVAGKPFDDAVVTLETYRSMFKHKYYSDVYTDE